jgi:succinate dehydrogenase/fumarate reductase flavoprotein subunit
MHAGDPDNHKADVVIIGGGAAGLRAAIEVAEQGGDVLLVTKGQAARSGATAMASPSYQAAFAFEDERDSIETAFEDTCFEGRYLGDENLIWALTSEATERAMELHRWGLKYRTKPNGKFLQVVHPGHSYERNLVIVGDGYAMAARLLAKLRTYPNVRVAEDLVVTKILTRSGQVVGVMGLDMRRGRPTLIETGALIVATGGYQELWRWTDTEPGLSGEGVYQCFEAGAELVDLEMMLFYPTGLSWPPEVEGTLVQYEGLLTAKYCQAPMLNGKGERFLPATDRLPVRDVMMKLMFREIDAGRASPHGGVYVDLQQSPKPPEEVLRILRELRSLPYNLLADLGINILEEKIEVIPVTHYILGGVRINEWGETAVAGLFAAGDVSGNIHGANRTSGNALAETQVFGRRAGLRAMEYVKRADRLPVDPQEVKAEMGRIDGVRKAPRNPLRPIELKRKIKAVMHDHVHSHRSAQGLSTALDELRRLREEDVPRLSVQGESTVYNYEWQETLEAAAMIDLAELVTASASAREESRGHHWRTDFPAMQPEWEKHTIVRRAGDHRYEISDAPVVRRKDRTKERRAADPALLEAGALDGYKGG